MNRNGRYQAWVPRRSGSVLASWRVRACAAVVISATTAIALSAQTFTTLHYFGSTDGAYPEAALVDATDGNLYGTTYGGGTHSNGTIFKITPTGALTMLYGFCSQSACADGANPYAGLVQAADGNFYGTTYGGGTHSNGTVFKITPSGTLTTLYSFCSQSGCTDGANPYAGLAQATDGNFYGTTYGGGTHSSGTAFKITPSGTLTTLYSFCSQSGCTDGANPYAGLARATDGNFYGTTYGGGTHSNGTVFKITPGGSLTTLHSFCSQSGCTDGANPYAGLVQAIDGNFYGTTYSGGAHGKGLAFKISQNGTLATLYSFCSQSGCTDGANPYAGLVQATDGNFYGTTLFGGGTGYVSTGTIFKITPSGTLATLHRFLTYPGVYPVGGLVQATNGSLYGTTQNTIRKIGFRPGYGTVFSLSVGLGPFVETQPTSDNVGIPVKILDANLTGATSDTFNGPVLP
jgi:uncharacterized repeat protein (TIGR03803 family)